jgi:hypothetical protein
MNERIQELARQSTGASTIYMLEEEWLKFAELIVRECAVIVGSMEEPHQDIAKLVKQHFGFEE